MSSTTGTINVPRPKRVNIVGIPQHIVQRGNNRQACFRDNADYRLYLHLLAVACSRHSCDVHAYVLMTNHVHLLLTPHQPTGASLVFRDLGRDYVRQFNKRHGRTGTLWEGRFKSSLVDSDHYLLACHRYIELNPVRAKMVDSPADYPWSSFRTNALGEHDDLVVAHRFWSLLGSDDSVRRRAYLRLFEQAVDSDTIRVIRDGLRKGIPTGSETFRRKLETSVKRKIGNRKRGRPRKIK